jgi:hypothetical protein
VREGRYYSEDWTFCENWRDLGGQVWVDKRVLLRHTGTYTFDGNAQEQVYKDLKAIFEPASGPATSVVSPAQVVDLPPPPPAEPVATVIASSKKKPKKVANSK